MEAAADSSAPLLRAFLRPEALAAVAIGCCAGILPLILKGTLLWGVVACASCVPLLWYAFSQPRRWPLLFCAAAILLPPFPFPIGDSGAHASIVIAAIGVLSGLAQIRAWRIERSALNGALATFMSALAVSLGFAVLYSGATIAAASTLRLLLFAAGIYVYFTASQGPGRETPHEAERTARWLFLIAAAAALFGCIDFVYQLPAPAGYGAQFIWLNSGVYRRAQGLFYDASALGNFCAFFLVMSAVALAHPARGRRIIPVPAACLGVVLFLSALILSFSRASLFAAGIGCMTLAILERKRWATPRAILAISAISAATIAGIAIMLPEFAWTYWSRLGVGWDAILASPDRVLSGRLETWQMLAGFIAAHPWQTFAGIGYKTLPYTQHLGRPIVADNMYLSSLVETGIFGFSALLALNATILVISYRTAKRGSFFGKCMFCFWVAEAFQMLAGDVLTFWRVLPVYFWVLAQVAREARES